MSVTLIETARRGLEKLRETGLLREFSAISENQGDWINLASNDYLGLARNPEVLREAMEAAERYGTSASGSPAVAGKMEIHEELEEALAGWIGIPHGLLLGSGFMANGGLMKTLVQPGDTVICDRLIHASFVEGARQSGAKLNRFAHNAIDELEKLLQNATATGENCFVVTESLYSMDGDIPDLKAIANLKQKYKFCWILDEAHALGWYGPRGAGLARTYGVEGEVDIFVATLGKALASQGAFILFQDPTLKLFFQNNFHEYKYTTYLSPFLVGAARGALRQIRGNLYLQQQSWHEQARRLRWGLQKMGKFPVIGESSAPIIPVIVGDEFETLGIKQRLEAHQILVAGIRPPSVPKGTSRLRLSLHTGITEEVIDQQILPAFKEVFS